LLRRKHASLPREGSSKRGSGEGSRRKREPYRAADSAKEAGGECHEAIGVPEHDIELGGVGVACCDLDRDPESPP
jgi:hypothetical protein